HSIWIGSSRSIFAAKTALPCRLIACLSSTVDILHNVGLILRSLPHANLVICCSRWCHRCLPALWYIRADGVIAWSPFPLWHPGGQCGGLFHHGYRLCPHQSRSCGGTPYEA